MSRLSRKNFLTIIFLVSITVILHSLIFSNQLNYGFRDVDWQVLYSFKVFGNLSLDHLLKEIQILGIYMSESYYIGFLEKFIGINFTQLHLVTHIFKIMAAISIYFLILKIFNRRLLAFIASLLYTISYTHAGVLFQLSSGGYFFTTIFMVLFIWSYHNSLFKKDLLKWSIVSGILLIISLSLKPERMYPLMPLIMLVEFFIMVLGKFKKYVLVVSFKRMLLIFLPVIIFSSVYQGLIKTVASGFTPNQFLVGSNLRMSSIMKGNVQLLLYPFSSFGSVFLYEDYWKLLGQLSFQNIGSFIFSLIAGPLLRLGVTTFILFSFIFKKPFRLTLTVLASIFVFGLIIFALNSNWQNIDLSNRVHFDPNQLTAPAIFGFYIFILGILFFIKWMNNKDIILFSLSGGIFFAFLFILLTWIPSDLQLAFMGPQRYLSIPSIGTGLFLAGVLVIIYDQVRGIRPIRNFAWMTFSLLIPLVIINYQVAVGFFDYELTYAGLRGSEQTRMKEKFRQLTGTIKTEDRSLFYFDETMDKKNGYFDEGTVMAGFEYWTRVNMDGSLNYFPDPGMMRTNLQCPKHTHQNCLDILKAGLGTENGQKGIWYKDPIRGNENRFYLLDRFYALRFINKNIIDIRKEVMSEIGEGEYQEKD